MAIIEITDKVGKTPRAKQLQKISVAFAENDVKGVMKHLAEGIQWNMFGNTTLKGSEKVQEYLESTSNVEAHTLQVENIITHGDTASVNGFSVLDDGITYAFCDLYRYDGVGKDSKITQIDSYLVELEQ